MSSYEWSPVFQLRLLALLIKHPSESYDLIEPKFFTDPLLVDISRVVKQAYSGKLDSRLHRSTIIALIKSSLKKSDKQYWSLYKQRIRRACAIKITDKEILLSKALTFAKESKFRDGLVQAEKDISNHHFDAVVKRFSELKDFGNAEKDLGIDYWEDIGDPERYKDQRYDVVPTGWPQLDRCMAGGLGGGELAIVEAGGKVGKTTVLVNIAAKAMYYRKNVAIATAELSAKKYRKRIDSLVSRIATPEIFKRRKEAKRKLRAARKRMGGGCYIKHFPTGYATAEDISRWLDELKDKGININMLLVDYIAIFKPIGGRSKERRENVGQVGIDLRGLAVERKIPVWTAAQVNRAALTKEIIGPKDLAEDISLFFTTDFLIALCQTEKEKQHDPPRARLFLVAARDVGSGGVIKVSIARDSYRIKERPVPVKGKVV